MTTRELMQRVRISPIGDPKRTMSLNELDTWLASLAAAGVLERQGDEWTPSPLGQAWLEPIGVALHHEAPA